MSLVDSSHLTPASRGRHGAHYKIIKDKPGMILYRDTESMPYSEEDKYCGNCNFSLWEFNDKCPKCGMIVDD